MEVTDVVDCDTPGAYTTVGDACPPEGVDVMIDGDAICASQGVSKAAIHCGSQITQNTTKKERIKNVRYSNGGEWINYKSDLLL